MTDPVKLSIQHLRVNVSSRQKFKLIGFIVSNRNYVSNLAQIHFPRVLIVMWDRAAPISIRRCEIFKTSPLHSIRSIEADHLFEIAE